MNSALVLCAYFAMLLSPCVVATYGDLLSVRWIAAMIRRRRLHRAESFLVSFRHERYAMAVAMEASFAAANAADSATFGAPMPFATLRQPIPIDSPGFVEARQRIAARLAQLSVAQKLRHAAGLTEKVVRVAAPVPSPVGLHIRPRKFEPVHHLAAHLPTHLVVREHAATSSFEYEDIVVPAPSVASPPLPVEHIAAQQPLHKPDESGALEIAA